MDSNLKLLIYIIIGLLLFWSVSNLFFGSFMKKSRRKDPIEPDQEFESADKPGSDAPQEPVSAPKAAAPNGAKPPVKSNKKENSGGLMICPVCSSQMDRSDMVKTIAFPPITPNSKERLMHILGCYYCMDGRRERLCPVCGKTIGLDDFLIARVFARTNGHSHVHVVGCTLCRPLKTM